MSNKQFISNLSATYADVRKLDVKKINLKGKNILEYIKESSTIILDERGTLANDELDIWNSYVTKDVNGNVIINRNAKPFKHSMYWGIYEDVTQSQFNALQQAVKVIDNEVLGENDEHIMFWQTEGLTDCYYIFYMTSLSEFSSDLSSLTKGVDMFMGCDNLNSFSSDLSSLTNGTRMFWNCQNLSEFSSKLPSLTDGGGMFSVCSKLTSFSSDLSSLTDGNYMFNYCENLSEFSSDLSSLTNGQYMFRGCSNLKSFNSDLSSLTNGSDMFKLCDKLESFSSDLSSLTHGGLMFDYCSKLESFNSDLSSLINGDWMFYLCKLDAQSVANIIHFIPQRDAKPTSTTSDGNIYIGVGITNTDAAKQAFAEECDCDDWADLNNEFDDKNWAVQWQFNGEAATFDLRGERPSTAVYARLEEVIMPTEEEIAAAKEKGEHIQTPHYEYTSQDGNNYYIIHWYHDSNTDNEGYDYFESLEMAALAYSVIPKA